ncbi:zona pellucida sperm-binding protein 3-like isoform X3 [Paralichthys olivaceus]|uniref:zona pellucida sperm-binding protein 3-like isoform X3 n=1 Tax=Paralichthys olivaceus TaxID=8255 RepID=UPI0037521338
MRLQPSFANHAACVKMAVLLQFTGLQLDSPSVALCASAASFTVGTRDSGGLEIHCGEAEVRVTVQRRLLEERRVPFRREHLRLGPKATRGQEASCGPRGLMSGDAAVISAGLQDCGAQSRKADSECRCINSNLATHDIHYRCIWPSALLPTYHDDCTSLRNTSVYQQGEAVFLEASVEAPLHPPLTVYVDYCVATLKPDPLSSPSYKFITKYGCLVDSVLPGSSSKFHLREQENRLCFSVQAFHFKQDSGEQMFISCHLRATPKQNSQSHLNKACYFHRPSFRWRATEGDHALCECCDSEDCLRPTGVGNTGDTVHKTSPHKETTHEADTTVGPLHTLPSSHWTGHLSVSH